MSGIGIGKGKRKLNEGGSSSNPLMDRLNNIKENIFANGEKILHKWESKIGSYPPNTREMMDFLLDVIDTPMAAEKAKLYMIVLRRLDYIPKTKFMKDFATNAERVKQKLGDRNFFLVLTCDFRNDLNRSKSNYFMSILFLCMHRELIPNFIDFLCVQIDEVCPIHDRGADVSSTFVYIDDVAFTGDQATRNLETLNSQEKGNEKIFAPVYATDMAVENLNKYVPNITCVRTDHEIRSFNADDIVSEYYERSGKLSEGRAKRILNIRLGIAEESKFLFYTDLKVPDSLSIFVKALFCLHTNGLTYSIVTGKEPTWEDCNDERGLVQDGRVVDTVYTTDEWLDFTDEIESK